MEPRPRLGGEPGALRAPRGQGDLERGAPFPGAVMGAAEQGCVAQACNATPADVPIKPYVLVQVMTVLCFGFPAVEEESCLCLCHRLL